MSPRWSACWPPRARAAPPARLSSSAISRARRSAAPAPAAERTLPRRCAPPCVTTHSERPRQDHETLHTPSSAAAFSSAAALPRDRAPGPGRHAQRRHLRGWQESQPGSHLARGTSAEGRRCHLGAQPTGGAATPGESELPGHGPACGGTTALDSPVRRGVPAARGHPATRTTVPATSGTSGQLDRSPRHAAALAARGGGYDPARSVHRGRQGNAGLAVEAQRAGVEGEHAVVHGIA